MRDWFQNYLSPFSLHWEFQNSNYQAEVLNTCVLHKTFKNFYMALFTPAVTQKEALLERVLRGEHTLRPRVL